MHLSRRIGIAVVTASLAVGSGIVWGGAPAKPSANPPVDARLLEFLGSVDASAGSTQSDDGSWLAYLSQINIGKVAKASQAPSPAQRKPASSASGANKPGGPGGG
ncbi:MAG: hypothetical protein WBW93_16105 [Steroidobacteraceae bacterium]